MVKILISIILILIILNDSSLSTNIDCNYGIASFTNILNTYYCKTSIDPNIITIDSAQITSMSGTHSNSKTSDDVEVFWASSIEVKYFPRDLKRKFKNLKGIIIYSCQLEEIHQEDLKPFNNLVSLRLQSNLIEIIEEGLFDYNSQLELVEFNEPKLIHIHANVFDHLSQLKYFWFQRVPCIAKEVDNSRNNVVVAIKVVKNKCKSSEFSDLEEKIKNLEIESKSSNFAEFKINFDDFETIFKNSKFSKFRPLRERFQSLKVLSNPGELLTDLSFKNITTKLEDLKSSKCLDPDLFSIIKNLQNSIDELKSSQNGDQVDIKSSISDQATILDNIKTSQIKVKDDLTKSIGEVVSWQKSTFDQITSKFNEIQARSKVIESSLTDSFSNLTSKFNDHKSKATFFQDELKGSMSDIEASISNVKASQNEVKSTLIKLKTSQNEIKIALDDLKVASSEDKINGFAEKLKSFELKLENIEEHFTSFEVKSAEKMNKELAGTRHKIAINLDEKLKGVEKRLLSKFEEVLEEKLEKIFKDKLGKMLNDGSGSV
ncbi:hypothetical protein ACKWTF_015179 [Chironomus riparius]